MSNTKKLFSLAVSIYFNYNICYFGSEINENHQIIQISIPKAGTHLLAKCIHLMTGRDTVTWYASNEQFLIQNYYYVSITDLKHLINLEKNKFWITHLFYSKEYANLLNNKNFKTFFIYRDPRDQVVSLAFYMLQWNAFWPLSSSMSFDDLLLDIIVNGTTFNNHPPVKNVDELYRAYLPWFALPNILALRFEDLIGSKGGGLQDTQLTTLKKIALHLQLQLSKNELSEIANKLFGETGTFREGKIGSWKKHFKDKHIKAFKQVAGQLLIDLGYEKDFNWSNDDFSSENKIL